MPYHTTGSMRRYSGGYGTIDIFLQNSSNLDIKQKYDYVVQTPTGSYKGFATADDVDGQTVLVDNTFTLPTNPPPYENGSTITIVNPQNGETLLETQISQINNHGEKNIFKFDTTTDDITEQYKATTISEELIISTEEEDDVVQTTDDGFTEIQPGVYVRSGDNNFYYEDGELIPRPPLPAAYQLPDNQNKCLNCSFYNEAASYCSKWKADIRQNYWCASWKGIQTEVFEPMNSELDENITTLNYTKFTEPIDESVEETTYQTNAADVPPEDTTPMETEAVGEDVPPPTEDEGVGDELETTFYTSPDIEDVGGQIDFYPTGSDGTIIRPDGVSIKRMIREKIYEGMYSAILGDEVLSADDVLSFQQTIRDGALAVGRSDGEILVYTKKDGNVLNQPGENIESILERIYSDFSSAFSSIESETELLEVIDNQIPHFLSYDRHSPNTEQFNYRITYINYPQISETYAIKEEGVWRNVPNIPNINFSNEFGKTIDIAKAQENLDTNIFELLPFQRSRQNEVDELFTKLTATDFLGEVPQFGSDGSITEQELANDRAGRISFDDNLSAAITRLDNQTNIANENKSLQSLRNTLNLYLKDVDNVVDEIDDVRPEYQNKSTGFLKLRKPNQAIIIRNPNGGELDFQKNDSYLTDGFTITMWVRFVGRTGHGTLFSYGNPYKQDVVGRYGFRLETFTVNKKDYLEEQIDSLSPLNPFQYSDYERFVRLVVWEPDDGKLYDSHFDTEVNQRQTDLSLPLFFPSSMYGDQNQGNDMYQFAFNYTRIPTDNLDEWFFICATYDPDADLEVEDRAKVEMISKRDLLTAKGFKVEEAEDEEQVEEEIGDDENGDDEVKDDTEPTKDFDIPKESTFEEMPEDDEDAMLK